MHAPHAHKCWPPLLKPLFLLVIFLSGCGERPPFPTWPKPPPTGPEQVVLSDDLSVSDIRQIVRAVNGSGRLQSLQPWVDKISDDQLATLGELLQDFIYQDALSSGSVMDLLEKRIDQDFFSSLAVGLEYFFDPSGTPEVTELFKALIGHQKFPQIVDLNIHWLDPVWAEMAKTRAARSVVAAAPDISSGELFGPAPGTPGWVAELHMALHEKGTDAAVQSLASAFTDTHFVGNTLRFLRTLDREQSSAEDLFQSVQKLASKPLDGDPARSQLSAFIAALNTLVGPSHGLFDEINELLKKPGISREIGNMLQPQKRDVDGPLSTVISYKPLVPRIVAKSIGRSLERSKSTNAVTEWKKLFADSDSSDSLNTTIRLGVEGITGAALPSDHRGAAEFNLPIFINSFALTEWVKHVAQANAKAIERLRDTKPIAAVWDLKVDVPALKLSITGPDGKFLPHVRAKLAHNLGGQSIQEILSWEKSLAAKGSGDWQYEFGTQSQVPFREALRLAVEHCDEVLVFSDISSVIRTALLYLTEPSGPTGQSPIQQLDSHDNLLLSINTILAGLPQDALELLSPVLNDSGSFADSVKDLRSLFERERPGPTTDEKTAVLDALETVIVFAAGLSSPQASDTGPSRMARVLSLYSRWLKALGPEEIKGVGGLIQFVHSSRLLESDLSSGETKFLYPAVVERLLGSDSGPAAMKQLALWEPKEIFELERGIRTSFSIPDGSEASALYLQWLRSLPPRRTEAWDGLLSLATSSNKGPTAEEKLWIQRFVREKGMHRVWQFFGSNGSLTQLTGLVRELTRLVEQGSLEGPLDLFEQIRDDRIKRIARVFKKWYHTGQFLAFLRACEKLIQQTPGAT
jgi:hypothetical protein